MRSQVSGTEIAAGNRKAQTKPCKAQQVSLKNAFAEWILTQGPTRTYAKANSEPPTRKPAPDGAIEKLD
jgi:hypothetical protein